MRLLSPSSQLVLAAVVVAVVALTVTRGSLIPGIDGRPSQTPPRTALGTPAGMQRPTSIAAPTATDPAVAATPVACQPTDQDLYVYNPDRLEIAAACIHVTGTIDAIRNEADGDLHILLNIDPTYAYLLRPENQGEELGDLVVEPVCIRTVTQLDAITTCGADPDPFAGPFPVVGERIWMEGRYVFDLEHGGWAELHPLYRWGDR